MTLGAWLMADPRLRGDDAAADWPQWRGPGRDGKSAETGLLRSWQEDGPRQLWSAEDLGEGSSPPSVTRTGIYIMGLVGANEVLFSLGLDGQVRWRTTCGPGWVKSHKGSRCQPTVEGNRIYFITSLIQAGCVDADTGRVLWSVDAMREFGGVNRSYGNAESPLIVNPPGGAAGRMIVTPGGPNASIVALDKRTGKTLWKTEALSQPACYCSPILVERGGLRIVVTMLKEGLVGVNADDGSVLWQAEHRNQYDNHMNSPVYADGLLYVTSGYGAGGRMFRLGEDGRSIEPVWKQAKPDTMHGGTIRVGGYIYGSSNRNPPKGQWICVDAGSGEVVYERDWVKAGSATYADGCLYCYGEDGRVALVPVGPDTTAPSGRFAVAGVAGAHCTHPVVCGGRLYLRRGSALMAFDVAR
jgi:outer membrane protein assembly factor BamB